MFVDGNVCFLSLTHAYCRHHELDSDEISPLPRSAITCCHLHVRSYSSYASRWTFSSDRGIISKRNQWEKGIVARSRWKVNTLVMDICLLCKIRFGKKPIVVLFPTNYVFQSESTILTRQEPEKVFLLFTIKENTASKGSGDSLHLTLLMVIFILADICNDAPIFISSLVLPLYPGAEKSVIKQPSAKIA